MTSRDIPTPKSSRRHTRVSKGVSVMSHFGSLLCLLRRQAGMTQEDLAERSGLAVRTIRNLERGPSANPQMRTVNLLADVLAGALDFRPDKMRQLLAGSPASDLGLTAGERQVLQAGLGDSESDPDPEEPADPGSAPAAGEAPDTLAAAGTLARRVRQPWQRRKDSLPAEVTRFIGRQRELSLIGDALGHYRLVTLCGAGGVGKTRLALRVAADVRQSFADGVWVAELSALRNAQLLARTVTASLGLPDQAAGDPTSLLADHLRDRHLLLVMDTCEHLVDACARLTETLLRAAPQLRILATSREPLNVMGEKALLISPLEVPDPGTPDIGCESVALFIDRAEAIVPGFTLSTAGQQAVFQICRGLDGIPLALELAAIRLRTMSLEQIAAQLAHRFQFLGPARTSLDRHQTLRAAVSWSYDLCTAAEQRLWARLSVFPGGFDLEAAERVGSGGLFSASPVSGTLSRLVEKSIVLCEQEGRRYRMLDTIREYGAVQLAELGEHDEMCRRHRDYYLGLAERAAAESTSAGQVSWLARLEQETANLRVALDYSYACPGQEPVGVRMTVLLRHYWFSHGLFSEGRRWHDRALEVDCDSSDGAWALYGAGVFALHQGDLGSAGALLDRAEDLANALHDRDLDAHLINARGLALFLAGDLSQSRTRYERAVADFAEIGYSDPLALLTYPQLAGVCCLLGELDRAVSLSEECLRRSEEMGEQWVRGSALWTRGAARWLSGDVHQAVEDTLGCLQIKESLGDLATITMAIDLLAGCLVTQKNYVRATELLGASDSFWKTLGAPIQQGPYYAEIRQDAAETCRQALGDAQFESARQRGIALSFPEAIAVARNATQNYAGGPNHRAEGRPSAATTGDPGGLDLMSVAGSAIYRRAVPAAVAVLVVIALIIWLIVS